MDFSEGSLSQNTEDLHGEAPVISAGKQNSEKQAPWCIFAGLEEIL